MIEEASEDPNSKLVVTCFECALKDIFTLKYIKYIRREIKKRFFWMNFFFFSSAEKWEEKSLLSIFFVWIFREIT